MRGKIQAGVLTSRENIRNFDKSQALQPSKRLGQDGAGQRVLIPADESIYHPRFHEQKQVMMPPSKRAEFESRVTENAQRNKEIQRRYLLEQKSVNLQKKKIMARNLAR